MTGPAGTDAEPPWLTRPRLRPGLPRVWRGPSTMQVGVSPSSGAVVAGMRAGDDVVLAALDGRRTRGQLRDLAREHGLPPERADVIVQLLADADLLVRRGADDRDTDRADLASAAPGALRRLVPDAQAWALAYRSAGDGVRVITGRARQHVHVEGDGRVAAAVATTLVSAGVGTVTVSGDAVVHDDDVLPAGAGGVDVGTSTRTAVRRAVGRLRGDDQPGALRRPPRARERPDLVVLVGDDVLDARRGDDLVRHDVPHLAVVAALDRVVVGPLVLPGRTACLRCLDLHRRDRDPAWPQVVAQLLGAAGRRSSGRAETASATAAAGFAALQALVQLDGQATPVTVSRTLELALPDGLLERRTWRLHAACGCARLPASPRVSAPRASA